MEECSELEISLYSKEDRASTNEAAPRDRKKKEYLIELRFNDPKDPIKRDVVRGAAKFDFRKLTAEEGDDRAYGKLLATALLGDPDIKSNFENFRRATEGNTPPCDLRVQLVIAPELSELHALRWERLRDPRDEQVLLFTKHTLLFSRYLSSPVWDRIQLRPKVSLRALVVVAGPTDLATREVHNTAGQGRERLAPVDVPGELTRARQALQPLVPTELASSPAQPGQVTMKNLAERLGEGWDILYLACHGMHIAEGEEAGSKLLLENEDGTGCVVPAEALLGRIADLPGSLRPRLVVLATCESGGTGFSADAAGVLAAVGPQLARQGIPAVLAMQGKISMQTVKEFMPKFFTKLLEGGRVDQAVAFARSAVAQNPDCWVPVLYSRLKEGRLWYTPSLILPQQNFNLWEVLDTYYQFGECTPVIGPGLSEPLLGSRRQIAATWAEAHGYPMDDRDREELAQVALFLAIDQAGNLPGKKYLLTLKDYLCDRYKTYLPADARSLSVPQLIEKTGAAMRQIDAYEVHNLLACLDFPIYITANPDSLLADALRARGKKPQEFVCHWRQNDTPGDDLKTLNWPDKDHPWVYYLFGRVDQPDSLVLTLDHFFEFLIVVHQDDRIPGKIWEALTSRALLFLGFEVNDWAFRVIFRSIVNQENNRLMADYAHVAVQINPQGDRFRVPDRARKFLETYFTKASKDFSVYWGRAEDFVLQMQQRLKPGGC